MNAVLEPKPSEKASRVLAILPSKSKPEPRRLPAVEQLYHECVVTPRRRESESEARVRYYQD